MTKLQLFSPVLDWVLRQGLAELFCPCLNLCGSQVSLSPCADSLLSVWLVPSTPAQRAWPPDATQTLSPSGMERVSLLLPNVIPPWEGGACWAEITIQQSFGGKKGAGYITANKKKDPPGTIPAILHLNIQTFSPFKRSGFFSQHSLHTAPRDLLLFTAESKVTCS